MLHPRNFQPDTRERGLLLEELRQLNVVEYTLGAFLNTPAGKKDVSKHDEYIQAITDTVNALVRIVDKGRGNTSKSYLRVSEVVNAIQVEVLTSWDWYAPKHKISVKDAWTKFQSILERLKLLDTPILDSLQEKTRENPATKALEACKPPLEAYIAYLHTFA